ncbi:hypothetical protein L6452_02417 [Arctium lappa]|uniref:Uncharacterized protein n=1 Tax=Arctium lappa TaxID=4217 RepID=A0ACB9FJB8_ARCLA|nr:hypothetical protein L6452_02417 [Arctium lappa]
MWVRRLWLTEKEEELRYAPLKKELSSCVLSLSLSHTHTYTVCSSHSILPNFYCNFHYLIWDPAQLWSISCLRLCN